MSDVNIIYKGESIATMDATGEKTLMVKKTIPADNIKIQYTKPQGGGSEEEIPDDGKEEFPDDGNLHIWITLYEDLLQPALSLKINGQIKVNWGDGSLIETVTGTSESTAVVTQHTYSEQGDYEIVVEITEGSTCIISEKLIKHATNNSMTDIYKNSVTKIAIGDDFIVDDSGYNFESFCLLKSISLPNGMEILPDGIFSYCSSLKNVVLPESLTSFGFSPFEKCRLLERIVIPESVTEFGGYDFEGCCNLKTVNIPNGTSVITDSMFSSCYSLESVVLPESVASIGESAFDGCSTLKSITLPESVASIGESAFSSCDCLEEIVIPKNVISLGNYSIGRAESLKIVEFKPINPPTVASSYSFNYINSWCIIKVPAESLDVYKTATNYPTSLRFVGV